MYRPETKQSSEPRYTDYFLVNPRYLPALLTRHDETGVSCLPPTTDLSEVEEKLLQHPAVEEAGVLEDKAFISLKDEYFWSDQLEQELKDWVRFNLSDRLVPREITVWDRLPKTRSGKVLRHALRAWNAGNI
ncbi:hypothetical protein SY88_08065 [Clostridiales bacterium PH28_bin88]|nr:hypothetical protein SY88_08065 [Clostridiales bacterium PH28_bin88]